MFGFKIIQQYKLDNMEFTNEKNEKIIEFYKNQNQELEILISKMRSDIKDKEKMILEYNKNKDKPYNRSNKLDININHEGRY